MLLIHPPAVRSTEPPLGAARLASYLRSRGLATMCLDLNREGLDYLMEKEALAATGDTWTRLALRRRGKSRELLREAATYAKPDVYRRAVSDLSRALKAVSAGSGAEVGLADYRDKNLSPLRRVDLYASARGFERNPYFPLFRARIDEELSILERDGPSARVVGLSLGYLSQALCAFAILGYLRAAHPRARLVLGGGLVNSWAGTGLIGATENFGGLVDALVVGPGEEGILSAIAGSASADGALGASDGNMSGAQTAGRGLEPSGPALPPDFSDFRGLSYEAPVPILPYNFSWGCPWRRCSFCPEKAEGANYAGLSTRRAMGEISALAEAWKPGLFHFTDNEIAPLYLRALADNPLGLPWYGFARFSPLLADAAFCRRLAASGCVLLQLGLESADQGLLDALCKGTRRAEIDLILENLAEAGIASYLYILFGTPAENRDSALRTRDYLAAKARLVGFLNLAIFNLPASSPEARSLATRDFYEGELSLYRDFVHPSGWGRDAVRAFIAKEIEGEGALRPILARVPPVFTSNHAPFLARR